MTTIRAIGCGVLGAALTIAAACGDGATTPTSPTTTTGIRPTELFSGTLPAGGSRIYSFRVTDPAYVTATLASVTAGVAALSTPLGLAFGTPAGTDCAMAESTIAAPALTAQLSAYKTAGIHCVRVYDAGQLTSSVSFSSVAPAAVLGLGVGIPRATGTGCALNRSIETAAGSSPQIAVSADAGEYCVQVYDPGRLSGPVSFAVTIAVP